MKIKATFLKGYRTKRHFNVENLTFQVASYNATDWFWRKFWAIPPIIFGEYRQRTSFCASSIFSNPLHLWHSSESVAFVAFWSQSIVTSTKKKTHLIWFSWAIRKFWMSEFQMCAKWKYFFRGLCPFCRWIRISAPVLLRWANCWAHKRVTSRESGVDVHWDCNYSLVRLLRK